MVLSSHRQAISAAETQASRRAADNQALQRVVTLGILTAIVGITIAFLGLWFSDHDIVYGPTNHVHSAPNFEDHAVATVTVDDSSATTEDFVVHRITATCDYGTMPTAVTTTDRYSETTPDFVRTATFASCAYGTTPTMVTSTDSYTVKFCPSCD